MRGLLEAEDRYSANVDTLEQQILTGQQQGASLEGLNRQLTLARSQLASVEARLSASFKTTTDGRLKAQWLARLRTLKDQAFSLQQANLTLLGQQGDADSKLTALKNELDSVDTKLFDIAQRLTRFDPEVREVDATAHGQRVFRATASYSYADLLKLNRAIAEQQQLIDAAKAAKAESFPTFRAAEEAAIASGNYLSDVMIQTAYATFVTKLAFDTFDVVKATASGGVVGAVAELGKKWVEQGLADLAGPAANGIEPGSIEADVNAELKAGLVDAWSQPQIERVVATRVLKDTILKSTKDGINKWVGAYVFSKVEQPVRLFLGDSPVAPGELGSQLEQGLLRINRNSRLREQLVSLQKGTLGNFAGTPQLKKFFTGEAVNFAKDALKTVILGALNYRERAAWKDFFQKESLARALYVPYHSDADVWEKGLERMDELYASKAQLLAGNREGQLATQQTTPFPTHETIEITLHLSGYRDPGDPVQVFVGGARAREIGHTDSYAVSGGAIHRDANGAVAIQLQ